jgi:hypothetical protein
MSELLKQDGPESKTKSAAKDGTSAVDAVRLVVNTAVAMTDAEPAISVRSVSESKRGPGIIIWIPGYVDNGETIVVAPEAAPERESDG